MQGEELKESKLVKWLISNEASRIFIMEFIATCILMFIATGVANTGPFEDHPSEPNKYRLVYVALTVYGLICFFGPLSGSHINPAVSLAVYLGKPKHQKKIKVLLAYWTAQFSGALLGVILAHSIYNNGGAVFPPMPQDFDLYRMCVQQILATFIFLFFILLLLDEETTFADGQAWVHLSIGLVYYFCLTISSQLHHLNPAVTFSLQIQAMIQKGTSSEGLIYVLDIILSQVIGGLMAHAVFRCIYVPGLLRWRNKCLSE